MKKHSVLREKTQVQHRSASYNSMQVKKNINSVKTEEGGKKTVKKVFLWKQEFVLEGCPLSQHLM